VTAGKGLVQRWSGPVEEIHPGDVVRIPPRRCCAHKMSGQRQWLLGQKTNCARLRFSIHEPQHKRLRIVSSYQ